MYTCFLDASKAFDRTNHFALFSKLLKNGVPVFIVRILAVWYRSQAFVAKWDNYVSRSFSVTNGVRQGGILSPYLFSYFMNDLSQRLNSSIFGCKINTVKLNHIFYADDLCLMTSSVYGLQKLVNVCKKFAAENGVIFNAKKTKCVYFKSKKQRNSKPGSVLLGNQAIDVVDKEKYLGHLLTSDMRDSEDMMRQKCLFYARGNSLIRKFKYCSLTVKRALFRSYCCSFYCSALWINYPLRDLQAMKVAYNNILRGFFNISRLSSVTQACAELSLPTFRSIYDSSTRSLVNRVQMSSNIYVRSCFCSSASTFVRFYREHV